MKIARDVAALEKNLTNPIITIGNFDGVHIGHQRVIKQVVNKALKEKGTSIILSFSPHTRKLLNHEKAPLLINTEQQKIELISAINPDYLCICEFDPSFASIKAEEFVKEILVDRLDIKVVYFSSGFAFGHKREGNISLLRKLSLKYGFQVLEVKPINKNKTMVNSSIIREMITSGQVDKAAQFLGRDYFIDGEVVAGDRRGRLLRYPTANILPENELLPDNGVYLSKLKLDDRILNGITNIGLRPTFSGAERSVETYLFDFNQKIYGKNVRLFFLKKIREEKKFAGSKQLAEQIELDIEKAHIFFRKH